MAEEVLQSDEVYEEMDFMQNRCKKEYQNFRSLHNSGLGSLNHAKRGTIKSGTAKSITDDSDPKNYKKKSQAAAALKHYLTQILVLLSNILLVLLIILVARLTMKCSSERDSILHNEGSSAHVSPSSCSSILSRNSTSPSGYYQVKTRAGHSTTVFCDMTKVCGCNSGPWMKVAALDLDHCPAGLKPKSFDGIRTCIANSEGPGCTSVAYSTFGVQYSKVCVKARGYGIGTFDGLYFQGNLRATCFLDNYLDGVSITTNSEHIWSFVAGACDCTRKPKFIYNHWTCDGTTCSNGELCSFLWNSSVCGVTTPAVRFLSLPTTSNLVVSVCRNEQRSNEDIAITELELHVQ